MNVGVDCRHLQAPHAYEIDVEFFEAEQRVQVLKIQQNVSCPRLEKR